MPGAYLWGWTGAVFKEVLVDDSGHLQVDALTVPTTDVHLYGYDSANWQMLLVQSAAQKNLRIAIYDSANRIRAHAWSDDIIAATDWGLDVNARIYGKGRRPLLTQLTSSDNRPTTEIGEVLEVMALLYGFDGTNFDRLRTYGTGILKVARAEVGLSTLLRTAAGQVKASAGKLYWVTLNVDSSGGYIELSNDLDGSTARVYRLQAVANDSKPAILDPPMEFSTGIYLKSVDHIECVIFGYL